MADVQLDALSAFILFLENPSRGTYEEPVTLLVLDKWIQHHDDVSTGCTLLLNLSELLILAGSPGLHKICVIEHILR